MDSVAKTSLYRKAIHQVMNRHAPYPNPTLPEEFETQLLLDDQQGHYYLMRIGWNGSQRLHHCLIHLDLKADKIWVHKDGTEYGVANELVDLGVAKQDIVLAFLAPYKRDFAGFATANA